MVEAMGGKGSKHYQEFEKFCVNAFLELRRKYNLILNLFSLMVDANIQGIKEIGREKAILKVREKFRVDLSDEEVIKVFQELIRASVENVMKDIKDWIHEFKKNF